jgi:hypothetical protein
VTRSTFAEEYGPIIEMAETRDASQILERIWSRPGNRSTRNPVTSAGPTADSWFSARSSGGSTAALRESAADTMPCEYGDKGKPAVTPITPLGDDSADE